MSGEQKHWSDKYRTTENLCVNCGHPRANHIGEANLKGEPKRDDSGWCTLPAGTCIFTPCDCRKFIEPNMFRGPQIPMKECVARRLYRIVCRNLSYGIYDGKGSFIGIRTKFGSRFLDSESHWDTGAPYGTVKGHEDLGVDLPEEISLKEHLGTADMKTGRNVRFDKSVSEGGRGWFFADTGEQCDQKEVRPVSVGNKALFEFLKKIEETFG